MSTSKDLTISARQDAAPRPATRCGRSATSTQRPRHARPVDARPTSALQRRLIAGMVG